MKTSIASAAMTMSSLEKIQQTEKWKAGMPAFQRKTHEVRDADTGKLICTLPIYGGGRMPTYRVVINEIYTN